MIHKDGRAMLIDFGIARFVQESSKTKKTAIGTPGYSPVEQCRGQVEPRSDLYALGATMHHLLTGIEPLPFKFEPLSKIVPGISPEVENIIMKVLKDNLAERFSNAREMKNAIESIGSNFPAVTPVANSNKTVNIAVPTVINDMILISGGIFLMGSEQGDNKEKPVHKVTVCSFYMNKYPITYREYKLYQQGHAGMWTGADYPVDTVSWYNAINYCNWLSDKEGFPRCYIVKGNEVEFYINRSGYRLPTEAEWEYACRAGTVTEYYWGNDMDGDYCWYNENSSGHGHSAGQKKPNAWGLYDMIGNTWEWCWDWYDENYYSKSPDYNPTGPASGSLRVIRGGSWYHNTKVCRTSYRSNAQPLNGQGRISLRLVRTA
jgi:formylglycine-generating enzyme required for sulfatase activity